MPKKGKIRACVWSGVNPARLRPLPPLSFAPAQGDTGPRTPLIPGTERGHTPHTPPPRPPEEEGGIPAGRPAPQGRPRPPAGTRPPPAPPGGRRALPEARGAPGAGCGRPVPLWPPAPASESHSPAPGQPPPASSLSPGSLSPPEGGGAGGEPGAGGGRRGPCPEPARRRRGVWKRLGALPSAAARPRGGGTGRQAPGGGGGVSRPWRCPPWAGAGPDPAAGGVPRRGGGALRTGEGAVEAFTAVARPCHSRRMSKILCLAWTQPETNFFFSPRVVVVGKGERGERLFVSALRSKPF